MWEPPEPHRPLHLVHLSITPVPVLSPYEKRVVLDFSAVSDMEGCG